MIEQAVFAIGYIVCIALAHANYCPAKVRTAWVLAANSVAGNLVIVAVGRDGLATWLLAIDIISAYALMVRPRGRTESALVWVYVCQLVIHWGHWGAHASNFYLAMLNVGGGFQIALLLIGAIYGTGRKARGGWHPGGNHRLAVAPVSARVARGRQ